MWWYIYVFIGLIAKKNGLIACVAYALHLQFESVLFLREGCACTCVCARVPVGIYFRKAPEVSQGVIPCYSLHMFAKKNGMDHWDVQRVASDLRFGARTMAPATATQRCGRKIRRREDGLANFKPLVAATYGGRFMIYP